MTGEDAPASPRAKGAANAAGISVQSAGVGTGPHGRIIERDVEAALAAGPGLTAGARGSDAYTPGQTGTGVGGRVTTADLAAPTAPGPVATATPIEAAASGTVTETPLKGIRKLIADRMRESLAVSAQLSYDMSASAEAMLTLRARLKATDPSLGLNVVTIGDLIGLVTAKVVRNHPNLNAHLVDGVLRSFSDVHLGMAVDTPRGLMVPTIRGAAAMGLREFAATTKDLAAQCQEGRISPDLLTGATFTVSNLGSFGITSFTPIVNLPQTGILGINAIVPAATIDKDGNLGVERRISFSLTADHQVVDGADAARFLRDLTTAIASVDLYLMA
jgi:pyruvate dehydrogenase E2 component (dihydrolipoamide acetyltransferase)